MRTTEEILLPPGEDDIARALDLFAVSVRAAYGDRLSGLFLFGSRARGDFEPFSDADVAVVLNDQDWGLVRETRRLARLANDVLIDTGVEVQAWPVSQAAWNDPARHSESALVENMRRDAKAIEVSRERRSKAPPPTHPPEGEGSRICIPPPLGGRVASAVALAGWGLGDAG